MSVYLGNLEMVAVDTDENGAYLQLVTDDGDSFTLRITDDSQLVDAVEGLREHVMEGRRERRLYDAASEEERDRVIYGVTDTFRASIDVSEEEWAELVREGADPARKKARESA